MDMVVKQLANLNTFSKMIQFSVSHFPSCLNIVVACMLMIDLVSSQSCSCSELYPYGSEAGDTRVTNDEPEIIALLNPIQYYGNNYYQIRIIRSGIIAFEEIDYITPKYCTDFVFDEQSEHKIFVYGGDFYSGCDGSILWRQVTATDTATITEINNEIKDCKSGSGFTTEQAWIVTWDRVVNKTCDADGDPSEKSLFQAVIAVSGDGSAYIIVKYKQLDHPNGVVAMFSGITSITLHPFTCEDNTVYLLESSNIGCSGTFIYSISPPLLREENNLCIQPAEEESLVRVSSKLLYNTDEEAEFRCADFFEPNNTNYIQTRKCISTSDGAGIGEWDGDLVPCIPLECEPIAVPRLVCQAFQGQLSGLYLCSCESGYNLVSGGDPWGNMEEGISALLECSGGSWLQLPADGISCEETDECLEDYYNDCEHLCVNYDGGYECQCYGGYELLANGNSCQLTNLCSTNETLCSTLSPGEGVVNGTCIQTLVGFECQCPDGYEFNDTLNACVDINECELGMSQCQDQCTNLALDSDGQRYVCNCTHPGYILLADGRQCGDLDECLEDPDLCRKDTQNLPDSELQEVQGICRNILGDYFCKCPFGYTWPRFLGKCVDIDECADNNGFCQHICNNTYGGFVCDCHDGYAISADERTCEDIDECIGPDPDCHYCINSPGSYSCQCKSGYELNITDSSICQDINECMESNGGCDHNCTNTDGSFYCSCHEGFELNNSDCKDIDECDTDSSGCVSGCANLPGSFMCTCPIGYEIDIADVQSCIDINECLDGRSGGCQHMCNNTGGSYHCSCQNGYQLDKNLASCSDIDECSMNNNNCEQLCINQPGSYMCLCEDGFTIYQNRAACISKETLTFDMCFDFEWQEKYSDKMAPETQEIIQNVEQEAQMLLSSGIAVNQYGITRETVLELYACSLGVRLAVTSPQSLSELEIASVSAEVIQILSTPGLAFNITSKSTAKLKSPPILIVPTQFDENTTTLVEATFESACDYINLIGFCRNGATCMESDNGTAECLCLSGFSGYDCSDTTIATTADDLLLDTTVLSIILPVLVLIAVITTVGVSIWCLTYKRQMRASAKGKWLNTDYELRPPPRRLWRPFAV